MGKTACMLTYLKNKKIYLISSQIDILIKTFHNCCVIDRILRSSIHLTLTLFYILIPIKMKYDLKKIFRFKLIFLVLNRGKVVCATRLEE